jgi:hypothetical protein
VLKQECEKYYLMKDRIRLSGLKQGGLMEDSIKNSVLKYGIRSLTSEDSIEFYTNPMVLKAFYVRARVSKALLRVP